METFSCWFCTEQHPGTGPNGIVVHVIEEHPASNIARYIMRAVTSEGSPALPPELPRPRPFSSPQADEGAALEGGGMIPSPPPPSTTSTGA